MYVTEEERQNATDFLTQVAGEVTCPVCGEADWLIEKVAVMALERENSEEEYLAEEGEPFAALQCQNCTNTLFFSEEIMEG